VETDDWCFKLPEKASFEKVLDTKSIQVRCVVVCIADQVRAQMLSNCSLEWPSHHSPFTTHEALLSTNRSTIYLYTHVPSSTTSKKRVPSIAHLCSHSTTATSSEILDVDTVYSTRHMESESARRQCRCCVRINTHYEKTRNQTANRNATWLNCVVQCLLDSRMATCIHQSTRNAHLCCTRQRSGTW